MAAGQSGANGRALLSAVHPKFRQGLAVATTPPRLTEGPTALATKLRVGRRSALPGYSASAETMILRSTANTIETAVPAHSGTR